MEVEYLNGRQLFVIPQFQSFYADFSVQLPWLTRALMAFSVAIRHNLLWIVLALTGIVLSALSWLRRESSGAIVDRTLMKLPLIGPLISTSLSSSKPSRPKKRTEASTSVTATVTWSKCFSIGPERPPPTITSNHGTGYVGRVHLHQP